MRFPCRHTPRARKPPMVATDISIPIHRWDLAQGTTDIVFAVTFQFETALDPTRVKRGLMRLAEIGDWRKLGVRIRQNESGQLEYHVPFSFSDERPAVSFSSVKHAMMMKDHPLCPDAPRLQAVPALASRNTWEFLPLAVPGEFHRRLADYLDRDVPLLSVHVVSFDDRTLLTLVYPHVLTDAQGMGALLRAWAAVLQGREDEVPPMQGVYTDPLASLGDKASTADFCYAPKMLPLFRSLLFGARYFGSQIGRSFEQRRLVVPQGYVDQLRRQALAELAEGAGPGDEKGYPQPFLSDGDVLLGWWTAMAVRAHCASHRRSLCITGVMDIRTKLQDCVDQTPAVYLGNAVLPLYTFAPGGSARERGIGYLAHAIRQSITRQRDPHQIEATAAVIAQRGYVPLVGDTGMQALFCTNWTKAGYFDVDFSGAVVPDGTSTHGGKAESLGKPWAIISNQPPETGGPKYTGVVIVGRDGNGNWQLQNTMSRKAMRAFERQLGHDGW